MKSARLLFTTLILIANLICLAQAPSLDSKIYGLLIGSAIGDAAGGPVEFVDPPKQSYWSTTNEALTDKGIKELAELFKLEAYPKQAEPYAQFEPYAPEGSITDDTRWKIILMNCYINTGGLAPKDFAESYWDFKNTIPEKYDSICDLWQEEYGYVMNYYLEKTPSYPPNRIWGGIPTMAGQMPFLPIAAMYPGHPVEAYKSCWEANILDVGYAKDITSALVSGLAETLRKDASWSDVRNAIKKTDPYQFSAVPWVPRKTDHWMEKASELVVRSKGIAKELYKLLEKELNAVTWWEAHVPLVVSFAFLEITDYDPLAALQMCMEFGHDTDSYAQVVGAFVGAMYGTEIFDKEMIDQVNRMMSEQYNQNVDDWAKFF